MTIKVVKKLAITVPGRAGVKCAGKCATTQ